MTSRERFEKTMSRGQPDRPPINIYFTPEVKKRLADYFERHNWTRDVLKTLEVDFREASPRRLVSWTMAGKKAPLPQHAYQDTLSKTPGMDSDTG